MFRKERATGHKERNNAFFLVQKYDRCRISCTGQVRVNNINHSFLSKMMTKSIKKREVTILEFQSEAGVRFKVTRRVPELHIAETMIFSSKEEAKQQFEKWLR